MSLFHVGCESAPSLSRRHSNRAEAHKHKVQRVNPGSLTSPSLPSMAAQHVFIERAGEGSPSFPSGKTPLVRLQGLPASRLYPKSNTTTFFRRRHWGYCLVDHPGACPLRPPCSFEEDTHHYTGGPRQSSVP